MLTCSDVFAGTLVAAEYVETDWALSFVYPALVMGAVGFVVFLFLAPEPRHVGLTPDRSSVSDATRLSKCTTIPATLLPRVYNRKSY